MIGCLLIYTLCHKNILVELRTRLASFKCRTVEMSNLTVEITNLTIYMTKLTVSIITNHISSFFCSKINN